MEWLLPLMLQMRDSRRFAHAGHPEQVAGAGYSGADQLPVRSSIEAKQEFEQVNQIDDPMARLNAIDRLRRTVLLRCGVRP
jgi:hypothetical protein